MNLFYRIILLQNDKLFQVYLAEQGLGGKCTLDPAWQEMLNHATQRVNEAETARAQAGAQHCRAGKRLEETSVIAQKLQRELRKSIAKSRFDYTFTSRVALN